VIWETRSTPKGVVTVIRPVFDIVNGF